jgi:hypothetical protein
MATRRLEIVEGPSKWDLLIKSLGEGQPIEFTLKGWGKFQACIMCVRKEDGSGESWIIIGHLLGQAGHGYRPFRASYSTKRRGGFAKVHEFVDMTPHRLKATL